MRLVVETVDTFFETLNLVALFGFLVFAVMLFVLSFFTYAVGGAGFLRYSDLLSGAISLSEFAIFLVVTVVSVIALAFLSVAVTLIVKLRRSLDDIGFVKMLSLFPKYWHKLSVAYLFLGAVTILIGMVFTVASLPAFATALTMLLLWAFFIFLPQSIVLKEHSIVDAMRDSVKFCTKKPVAVILTYVATLLLLISLIVMEVLIGQLKIFWITPLFSSFILFILVIPLLEIFKANLYLTKYKLLLGGL